MLFTLFNQGRVAFAYPHHPAERIERKLRLPIPIYARYPAIDRPAKGRVDLQLELSLDLAAVGRSAGPAVVSTSTALSRRCLRAAARRSTACIACIDRAGRVFDRG